MENRRNSAVDIFRFISSLMIFIIHVEPFPGNSFINFFVRKIICAVAVPFFFAISGYYFFRKLKIDGSVNCLKNSILRIVEPYLIWSIVYIVIDVYRKCIIENMLVLDFLLETLDNFFISGSFYHLWFIPALVFATVVCYFIFIKNEKLLIPFSVFFIMLASASFAYYYVGVRIPIFGDILENNKLYIHFKSILCFAFPYFSLGYLIEKFDTKVSESKINGLFLVSIILYVCEGLFVYKFTLYKNSVNSLFLYFLIFTIVLKLLNSKININAKKFKIMSVFNYYSHAFFIFVIRMINPNISSVVLLFFVLIICNFTGYVIYKIDNKFLNRLV